jgi:hypothetical protein
MAKAQLTTKSGTKVTIEGSADEVADLLARFEGGVSPPRTASVASSVEMPARTKSATATPANLISELATAGFFATPKELNAIKVTLEEQGHFYPATTLSPTLLRLVRKRQLRRIKDKKRWVYVA